MATDPGAARAYFESDPAREWDRLEATLHGRTKYAIHRSLLDPHLRPRLVAADIGSGPGRFAIDMLSAGMTVALGDISPGQLGLARERIEGAGLSAGVTGFHELDVVDLSLFETGSFDLVLAFGGPVSYAFDGYEAALDELVRITKPGGTLLLSVMSLLGTLRLIAPLDAEAFVRDWHDHLQWDGRGEVPGVALSVPGSNEFHAPVALFTAAGLRDALVARSCEVLRIATSNPVSQLGLPLAGIAADTAAEERLRRFELAICEAPGLLDAGEHIVVSARRR